MVEVQKGVSIDPESFVEGGAVPVDRNLLWTDCSFVRFQYTKKDGSVSLDANGEPIEIPAARIVYKDDDGAEFVQHYSAGDLSRFEPSKDGKSLIPVGGAQALSKSSNYYILMNALVNAGFPKNKLGSDISILNNLYAFHIGATEPTRTGLVREPAAAGARPKTLSVPSQILKLPWENKAAGKTAAGAKGKAPVEETGAEDVVADAVALVTEALANADSVTRQVLSSRAIRAKKKEVATLLFKAEFDAALTEAGFVRDGETITAA